jgi:hypothetical protein
MRKYQVIPALAVALGFALLFQNCSKVGFNYDYNTAYSQSGVGMVVNNGNPYTNQRVIGVQFTGQTQIFTQMRFSTNQDMDTNPVPWQTFAASTAFDLGSSWAPDGSKDGPVTIYAQIRKDDQSPTLPLAGSLGLDTTPPTVAGLNILVNGIQGQDYVGQTVPLNFTASDKPAPTGYESGLAPAGFRVGWTYNADCGNGVTWLGAWGPVQGTVPLTWPVQSTLDTFYVCAETEDNAGNISTFLSQPLTSVWRVFAGDNNPGDGETYNGPNVRFKLPQYLAMDSKGNLYNSDAQFNVIREINRQTGIITTIAGNGQITPPQDGPALESGLSGNVNALAIDSQDNFYFSSAGSVYQLAPDDNGVMQISTLATLCSSGGTPAIVSHFHGSKEYLLIASSCGYTPDSPSQTMAYIYDVPTSVLLNATSPLQQSDLAKYIFAGNGSVPPAPPTFNVPVSQVLTVNGSGDQNSIGAPSSIGIGAQGEIYLATRQDPNGEAYGNYTTRRLTVQKDGTIQQDLLATNAGGASQIAYAPSEGGNPPFLLLSTLGGLKQLSLSPPPEGQLYPITNPTYISTQQSVDGVLIAPPQGVGDLPEFYISVSTLSQIYHVQFDVATVIEIIGRNIYNPSEPVATQAIIGQPEGMVQDSVNGDTYFFDSMNDVVRKISSVGTNPITLISGTPGFTQSQDNSGHPLLPQPGASPQTGSIYNGLSAFTANGSFPMAGIFSGSTKMLYLSEGRVGQIHQLDITNNVVQTIAGVYTNKQSKLTVDSWDGQALAIAKTSTGQSLLDLRFCPYADCSSPAGTSYYFTGFLSEMNLPSPVQDSEVQVGGLLNTVNTPNVGTSKSGTAASQIKFQNGTTMRVDSLNNLYLAAGAFYMFPVSSSGSLSPVINISVDGGNFSPGYFEMFPDNNGKDRVLIYLSGPNLCTVRIPNVAQITPTNVPTGIVSQQLLLPGTFLKKVKSMTPTNDGNLLISDASNGRILEYFIHNSQGQLDLQTVCSENNTQSCPCSNQ